MTEPTIHIQASSRFDAGNPVHVEHYRRVCDLLAGWIREYQESNHTTIIQDDLVVETYLTYTKEVQNQDES